VAADTPLPVRIEIEELGPLSSEIQTAVYFTCTEAIQNACKHAHDASCLRLRVCGFVPLSAGGSRH